MPGDNKNFTQALAQTEGEIQREIHSLEIERRQLEEKKLEVINLDKEIIGLEAKIKTDNLTKQKDVREESIILLKIKQNEDRIRVLRDQLTHAQRAATEKMKRMGFKDLH